MTTKNRDMIGIIKEDDVDLGFQTIPDDYSVSSNNQSSNKKQNKKTINVNVNGEVSSNNTQGNSALPLNYKNTYNETDNLIRSTIGQIDQLSYEIQGDINNVRKSVTMKNKYTTLGNLVEVQASLINNKISAIKEMNSTISKAHELEFKRLKEMKLDANAQDDNKMIMDLYSSMISNPNTFSTPLSRAYSSSIPTIQGGMMSIDGSSNAGDAGFNSYMKNMTPEQNMMLLESNPNVEEVICYDPTNGRTYFDVIDSLTGQSVPNTPKKSAVFLDNTVLDLQDMVGRNTKLNQTWRIVMVGPGKYSQPKILESY